VTENNRDAIKSRARNRDLNVSLEPDETGRWIKSFNVNLPEILGFMFFALVMMGMIWGYNIHTDDVNAQLFKTCVQNHRTIAYTSDGKILCNK
jgi:hypothetical protein